MSKLRYDDRLAEPPRIDPQEPLPVAVRNQAKRVYARLRRRSGARARAYGCQFSRTCINSIVFIYKARRSNRYVNIQQDLEWTNDFDKFVGMMLAFFRHIEDELAILALRTLEG